MAELRDDVPVESVDVVKETEICVTTSLSIVVVYA